MRKLSYIALILMMALAFSNVKGQQLPQFTQYLLNDYVINPAIGGSRGYFDAKANQRLQWVGVTDAPRTFIFSLHGPLQNEKVGLGGYLFSDITGPTRRSGVRFSYAYHLNLSSETKLSFGVSGGLLQFVIDGSQIDLRDNTDLAISDGIQSVVTPDAGAGIYLYHNDFFVSISSPQLLGSQLQFFDSYEGTLSRLTQHYYGMAGYNFYVGDFTIQPSGLVKYVQPFFQYEVGLKVEYSEIIWLGGTYRQQDSFGALLGYNINDHFSFAYSYDIPFANFSRYSNGSHEVMLQMRFDNRD